MSLTPTKDKVIKAFKNADKNGKNLLIDLYGKEVFSGNQLETIKTFADVCEETGMNEKDYEIPSSGTVEQKITMYIKRLRLIASVFNGDWKANLADIRQYKYYPWFNIIPDNESASGFRLSFVVCGYGDSGSVLGARLYYRDKETAVYVGNQFLSEYEGLAQSENLLY